MRNTFYKVILSICLTHSLYAIDKQKLIDANKEGSNIVFIENKGQVSDQNYNPRPDVLFSGSANGINFHLKNNGVSYQLTRIDSLKVDSKSKLIPQSTIYRLDINWLGINPNFKIQTGKPLDDFNNYYLEVCPRGLTNVKKFNEIQYNNLYYKINLHYYKKDGILKYDYVVEPGGDYKKIQLEVTGAIKIKVQKDGSLIFKTPLGEIEEGAPIVYQNNHRLNAKWVIKKNKLSFKIENYDSSQPLIIDPVVRLWGTYYGGAGDDRGYACTTDKIGNVYLGGSCNSNIGTTIATSGAHQTVFGGSNSDAFLAKFDSNGIRQWGTYYGGSLDEIAVASTTDLLGNVYLTGYTTSTTTAVFSTVGAHQTLSGGGNDLFIVKFNSIGVRRWATFYGGSGDEIQYSNSCATDTSGNVYVAGDTGSGTGTVIATASSHQSLYGGSISDAFLVKFDSIGIRQWGTYYGGTGFDYGWSCSTDLFGNIYLGGNTSTNTSTVIATTGAHQTTFGGSYDGYLVKFNAAGIRQWGTYYGGSGIDRGWSCTTDGSGNIYLTGNTDTNTGNSIATTGSHQSTYGGGSFDAYLVKFNANGIRQWGTYFGGFGDDRSYTCTSDISKNIYVTGYTWTNAGTSIATVGSHQSIYGGGSTDAYLVKFDSAGVRQWGTYYGGSGSDYGQTCYTNASGHVYLAGLSSSNSGTIIATPLSHQSIHGGTYDAFLVKFDACNNLNQPIAILGNSIVCSSTNSTFSVSIISGATSYSWNLPSGWSGISSTNSISATSNNNSGIVSVTAINGCSTSQTQTLNVNVISNPTLNVVSNASVICVGQTATLSAGGATSYTWNTSATTNSIAISPTITTTYTLIGITNNCRDTTTFIQNVSTCATISEFNSDNSIILYPNPNNGSFNLQLGSEIENGELILFNVIGQKVFSQNIKQGENVIKTVGLAKGLYHYSILQNKTQIQTGKIVIE